MLRPLKVDDLLKLKSISSCVVSPDGKRMVVALKSVATPSATKTNLWEWHGKRPRAITRGRHADTNPQFDAHGMLYFQSNRAKPRPAVFVESDQGPVEVFSMPEGAISGLKVSPDGKKFAFLYRPADPNHTKEAKASRKRERASEPPLEFSQFPWRLDGDGEFGDRTWTLMVWSGGKASALGPNDCWAEIDFTWAPDSQSLFVSHDPRPEPFMEPNDAVLERIELTGKATRLASRPGGKSMLSVSPSGRYLALVLDPLEDFHWGIRRQRILVHDLKTGEIAEPLANRDLLISGHPLSDCRDMSSPAILWKDEETFGLPWSDRGVYGFAEVNWKQDEVQVLYAEPGEIHLTAHHQGTYFGWVTSTSSPTEAVRLTAQGLELLSPVNRDWLAEVAVATPTELNLPGPGGTVHGWHLTSGKGRKKPAVISVHGGPACFYSAGFFFELQLLAANGYEVFYCNPRGSTSYGESHARSILGAWGEKDWEDIQILTQAAKKHESVDPERVSIIGGSYGGFMVNWAIAHDPTYHRAVSDRCVSNLISKWGTSDYPFVPNAMWPGCVFRNDIDQLWESSPIKHFGNAKTPTLIVHSVGDLRCAIEQGEQVFTALKMLGVRTKMIRYPVTTSHGMSRNGPPDLRMHRLQAYLNWLGS